MSRRGDAAGKAFSARGVRSLLLVPAEARTAFAAKMTHDAHNCAPTLDGAGTGFIGAPPFLFVVEASRTSLNSDLISAMCVR